MPEISKTLQPVFTTNFILVTIINLFVFFSFQMIFPTRRCISSRWAEPIPLSASLWEPL